MTISRPLRRSGAILTSVGVAAALTLLTPAAGQAKVQGSYVAMGFADADYNGPTVSGECTLTLGDSNPESSPAEFSHGTKRRSVDLDATFTSPDNAGDTARVRGHVDTRLTLKKHQRDLRSLVLSAGGSIKVRHSMSHSSCAASGALAGQSMTEFTEHKKGWLYLTHDVNKANAVVETEVINLETQKVMTVSIYAGDHSRATSRVKLKPGHYGILAVAGLTVGNNIGIGIGVAKAPAGPSRTKAKLTTRITVEFKPLKKH